MRCQTTICSFSRGARRRGGGSPHHAVPPSTQSARIRLIIITRRTLYPFMRRSNQCCDYRGALLHSSPTRGSHSSGASCSIYTRSSASTRHAGEESRALFHRACVNGSTAGGKGVSIPIITSWRRRAGRSAVVDMPCVFGRLVSRQRVDEPRAWSAARSASRAIPGSTRCIYGVRTANRLPATPIFTCSLWRALSGSNAVGR